MRIIITILFSALSVLANPKELTSFSSSFEQTITDPHKKIIRYSGELWASKPQNALWIYKKPVNKKIYINGSNVTIIEPDLEQAIIKKLDDDIDFLAIIKNAKQVDNNNFIATVKSQKYNITLLNDIITSINYKDDLDNNIEIKFTNPLQNKSLNQSIFKPVIPNDYDVIR